MSCLMSLLISSSVLPVPSRVGVEEGHDPGELSDDGRVSERDSERDKGRRSTQFIVIQDTRTK